MLRLLHPTDLTSVLAIEQSVHVAPWAEETFKICFQSGYMGWVIELEQQITGFIIVSLQTEECHVLNLCVARAHQHQGWGQKLLEYALSEAKKTGITIAYLEVRCSNARAIALYKRMQFHLIGTRKDYYPTVAGNEDAFIFAKRLSEEIDEVLYGSKKSKK